MTSHYQSCPYCEAEQPFPLRHRQYKDSSDIIEVYIACTRCPFNHTMRLSTRRREELLRMRSTLQRWGQRQEARNGVRSSGSISALRKVDALIAHEETKLP